ncbi:MAG: alanine dehydrogenase [Chitinophagales bacterium]|nr:alanine dehydrogenase [Bacteroidota bacterium]MCB9043335.1 alanine dehydrogenase [Chitinophagales bacterium]
MQGQTSPQAMAQMSLEPLEERLAMKNPSQKMFIGIPRETAFQEKRIALTPESTALLINNGHRIVMESQAGLGAHYKDSDYSETGVEIAYDLKKVYEADIILKVAPPSLEEIDMLHPLQVLFSPIHLPMMQSDYLAHLMRKQVTGIAFEYIKDEYGSFPIVRTLSEIAGSSVIYIAAEYLSNSHGGQGILLGGISGIPPARIVVLGAGVVGEYVTRTALGLGADVHVFDSSIFKLMRLQKNLGRHVFTSIINPETLRKELAQADIAVGAIHSELGRAPCVVTEAMVAAMRAGSVIIDVSIDQGGCFETSRVTNHLQPTFRQHDVIHYCVPNIAARVSKTASQAISNVLAPLLLESHEQGGLEKYLRFHKAARHGVYVYKGKLTNQFLSERFGMRFTNLDLLMTAGF